MVGKRCCSFYDGDGCTYEDYCSNQTEDGYCKKEGKCVKPD
jgi:hypothetical protein